MKRLSLILIGCSNFLFSYSQQLSVSDMQIPDAPGFVLADKAPSSIDKPTSPRAFAISLYSLQQGGAVQATPFWYFNHATLDQKEFLKRSAPFWQTLNVSLATFKTDSSAVLSGGFRFHLLRIYSKQNKADVLYLDSMASVEIAALTLPGDEEKGKLIIKKYADQIAESVSKPDFRFEIAGAYLGSSESNSFKSLSATKAGLWANFSYSPYKSNLILTGLLRYSWAIGADPKIGSDSSFLDYGISVSYQKNRFDLAVEFLNRNDLSRKENFNRLAFVINYEISDEITLVSSFGRNFTDVNNIFSVFGAKFGVSHKRKKI